MSQGVILAEMATRKKSKGKGSAMASTVPDVEADLVDAFLDAQGELGDGIVLVDDDGIAYANEVMARMLGHRTADIMGRSSIFDFMDAPERDRVATRQRVRIRSAQGIDHGETRLLRKDGVGIPVDYVARRVGRGARTSTLWIIHDISRERWTDDELKASESRFSALSTAVGDGLVFFDATGKIVDANSGSETLIGLTRSELRGRPFESVITLTHTTEGADAGGTARAALDRADGGQTPVEVTLARMPLDGQVLTVAVVRDITGRVESETRKQQALEDLQKLTEARTEFINMAAHELRTPIAPIKAEIALLKSATAEELGNDQRKSVDALSRNVERLSEFVEDLLEVSRMQAGRLELDVQRVDLGRLVTRTVGLFEAAAHYGDVKLTARAPPNYVIRADASRLEQVIFNLVSNALKFTPGGGKVDVIVKRRRDGWYVVEAHDTGIGFSARHAEKLFKPFGQIDKAHQSQQKGAGLGLYICKTLVELHGGRVEAKSAGPKKGSVFTVLLPRDAEA